MATEELPPTVVTGPDEDGIKTIVEYYRNDQQQLVKKTTRMKVITSRVTMSRRKLERIEARRALPKFGQAKGQGPGVDPSTTIVSNEDVYIEAPTAETGDALADQLEKMAAGKLTINRKWTSRREQGLGEEPKKGSSLADLAQRIEEKENKEEEKSETKSTKYVPPGRRNGAKASSMPEEENTTLRVSNIDETATDQDLRELFGRFGRLARVHMVKNRTTGRFRGFAFVCFREKADAEQAMENLNGHPYGYQILEVEWAKPSKRDGGGAREPSRTHYSGYGKALPQG